MKRLSSLFSRLPSPPRLAARTPPAAAAAMAAVALAAVNAAATPFVLNPYTFVGRVSDSHGAAFDDKRTATLTACETAAGRQIAQTATFFRDDSRNNYALQIPMSSSPVEGYAEQGDLLAVAATDDLGRTWAGVIDPAVVGVPGTVSEVDIVLADDADGDGIDDELYRELFAAWSVSPAAAAGGEFDPRADHDGDGMSSLDEAMLGTDPFDGDDVLKIDAIEEADGAPVLFFSLPGGHSYAVQESHDLTGKDSWRDAEFVPEGATQVRSIIVTPSSADRTACTIYLFPGSLPAFYRLSVR